jgi:hypothetical protein
MNFAAKSVRVNGVNVKALAFLFALCALLGGNAALAQAPGVAKSVTNGDIITFDAWNARYCEIFLIKGEPGNLEADVYNTLGLNTCPPDQLKALDSEALKQQYHALGVFKNGPRYWVVDKLS